MTQDWDLPEDVRTLFHYFHTKAAALFLVGGAVRDFLLGIKPHDYDFTVDIPPDELVTLLQSSPFRLDLKGQRFGTIGVLLGGKSYEITSFRQEDDYSNHRHPEVIRFTPSIEEDLARRDFTVNAMAWSPATGLVDPYGGLEDLRSAKIRAVGEPRKRMSEDALRILRAVRFAAELDAEILPATAEAMEAYEDTIASLPGERIGDELLELFMAKRALELLALYPWVWPRSLEAVGKEVDVPLIQAGERLDPVGTVVQVFLSTPELHQTIGSVEVTPYETCTALSEIYRRSDLEDLRALRRLLDEQFSLNIIDEIMRAWAWPEDFRRSVLLTLLDYVLIHALSPMDISLAAVLYTPERYERITQLCLAREDALPEFSVEDICEFQCTIPHDQAELGWLAEDLMAEGYRGEGIRQRRARGLLERWC